MGGLVLTQVSERDSAAEEALSAHDEAWLDDVLQAMTRAAKQAHLRAYQTGTGVVYRRNGKFGVYAPDPEMYEDLIPPPFVEQPES